ncbi:hypothetical protein T439DRAFT_360389 [Meredithblackwellia eburnea MCA 4105]
MTASNWIRAFKPALATDYVASLIQQLRDPEVTRATLELLLKTLEESVFEQASKSIVDHKSPCELDRPTTTVLNDGEEEPLLAFAARENQLPAFCLLLSRGAHPGATDRYSVPIKEVLNRAGRHSANDPFQIELKRAWEAKKDGVAYRMPIVIENIFFEIRDNRKMEEERLKATTSHGKRLRAADCWDSPGSLAAEIRQKVQKTGIGSSPRSRIQPSVEDKCSVRPQVNKSTAAGSLHSLHSPFITSKTKSPPGKYSSTVSQFALQGRTVNGTGTVPPSPPKATPSFTLTPATPSVAPSAQSSQKWKVPVPEKILPSAPPLHPALAALSSPFNPPLAPPNIPSPVATPTADPRLAAREKALLQSPPRRTLPVSSSSQSTIPATTQIKPQSLSSRPATETLLVPTPPHAPRAGTQSANAPNRSFKFLGLPTWIDLSIFTHFLRKGPSIYDACSSVKAVQELSQYLESSADRPGFGSDPNPSLLPEPLSIEIMDSQAGGGGGGGGGGKLAVVKYSWDVDPALVRKTFTGKLVARKLDEENKIGVRTM